MVRLLMLMPMHMALAKSLRLSILLGKRAVIRVLIQPRLKRFHPVIRFGNTPPMYGMVPIRAMKGFRSLNLIFGPRSIIKAAVLMAERINGFARR